MKEKIFQDLKEAMRAQDVARRTTLRMVVAAIKNLEIETSSELESGDVLQIIQKQVKSRRESIEEFRKGNREDLIAKEQTEITGRSKCGRYSIRSSGNYYLNKCIRATRYRQSNAKVNSTVPRACRWTYY